MGAQASVDFRKVPEHSRGAQPGLRVQGEPEVGKKARECKKREDEGVCLSVQNPADLFEPVSTKARENAIWCHDSEFSIFPYIP